MGEDRIGLVCLFYGIWGSKEKLYRFRLYDFLKSIFLVIRFFFIRFIYLRVLLFILVNCSFFIKVGN